jgi:hypothetical protein
LSTNSWDDRAKPWPESVCRDRYVEGDRVGLRQLSEMSGVPFRTLAYWSKNSDWTKQRETFCVTVATKAQRKSLERVSDELADRSTELVKAHLKALENQRTISARFFEYVMISLAATERGADPPDKVKKGLDFLIAIAGKAPVSTFATVLQVAIAGEREAAWMNLASPSILERKANELGLMLISAEDLEGIEEP